ncbi:MAG: hypothetical protein V1837_08130 [Candidatus Woesearchaeota archaeon]
MDKIFEINKEEGYVIVSVNPKIYPLDVVLSAAYLFTENNYVLLDGDPKDELIVEIRPKEKADLEKVGMEFNNELIRYANYAVAAIKNQKLREAIISRVMMTNSLDPLEALKPWAKNEESNNQG